MTLLTIQQACHACPDTVRMTPQGWSTFLAMIRGYSMIVACLMKSKSCHECLPAPFYLHEGADVCPRGCAWNFGVASRVAQENQPYAQNLESHATNAISNSVGLTVCSSIVINDSAAARCAVLKPVCMTARSPSTVLCEWSN